LGYAVCPAIEATGSRRRPPVGAAGPRKPVSMTAPAAGPQRLGQDSQHCMVRWPYDQSSAVGKTVLH
jgi:hypothetical protein